MAIASGQSESLYIGPEASYKTLPGTVVADKVPIISHSIRPDVSEFTSEAKTGSPAPRPVVFGKENVGGSFELECSPDSLMMPLRALMGAAGTSDGVTGFYDHTFTFSALTESFFIEDKFADITQFINWKGIYVSGASFNWDPEGLMRATFNVRGANQTPAQATIINGTTTDQTGAYPFEYMAASVKRGGTVVPIAQNVTLDIDRGLQPIMAIDATNELIGFSAGIATIRGRFRLFYQDATMLDLVEAGTETSIEILNPAATAGHGLKVIMPNVKLRPTAPTAPGSAPGTLEFEYRAFARGTASNIAGQAQSKALPTGYTFTGGVDDLLKVKVDGGAAQDVTFTAGLRTLAQMATEIDTVIATGGSCVVENNRLVIKSDATTGASSSIQIDSASTADTVLGFDNDVHVGYNAQPLVFILTNAQA